MLPLGPREQSLRIGMWIEVQMRTLSFFRLETGLGTDLWSKRHLSLSSSVRTYHSNIVLSSALRAHVFSASANVSGPAEVVNPNFDNSVRSVASVSCI